MSALTHAARVRRALYRSWQCGIKECELVIGNWATKNQHRMMKHPELLQQLEQMLQCETPQLLKFINGQAIPPQNLAANVALREVLESVKGASTFQSKSSIEASTSRL